MLDIAMDYRLPLNDYIIWHQNNTLSSQSTSSSSYFLEHPTDEEWTQVECMHLFLKVFYDATVAMSASYESTVVNFYHHLIKITDIFSQYASVDTFIPILIVIREKFEKYWNTLPIIYGLAVIIDPRLKEAYLPNIFDAIYGSDASSCIEIHITRIKLISVTFKRLFNEYSAQLGVGSDQTPAHPTPPRPRSTSTWAKIKFGGSSSRGSTSGGETSVSELQQYLNAMTVEPDDDFNILAWWKSHEGRFPVLSTMARDILTYPVSTVASESTFSTGW